MLSSLYCVNSEDLVLDCLSANGCCVRCFYFRITYLHITVVLTVADTTANVTVG